MIKYHGFTAKGFVNPSRQQAVMLAENLKSASITSLDATPPVLSGSGQGGAGYLRSISDTILPVTGATAPSTYRMVRIPTTAKVKHIFVQAAVATDFDADIGLYFSDSLTDGSPISKAGAVVTGDLTDFFAAAFDFDAALVAMIDVAYLNPSEGYLITDANSPIWKAANLLLTVDPGGYFDIVLTTTVTNSVPLAIYCECQFVI
jgi:hypothetical protein